MSDFLIQVHIDALRHFPQPSRASKASPSSISSAQEAIKTSAESATPHTVSSRSVDTLKAPPTPAAISVPRPTPPALPPPKPVETTIPPAILADTTELEEDASDARIAFPRLHNPGNACYLNATLQAMYNSPIYQAAVNHKLTQSTGEAEAVFKNRKTLQQQLRDLFHAMQIGSDTKALLKDLYKTINALTDFNLPHVQNDAHQLLAKISEFIELGRVLGTTITECETIQPIPGYADPQVVIAHLLADRASTTQENPHLATFQLPQCANLQEAFRDYLGGGEEDQIPDWKPFEGCADAGDFQHTVIPGIKTRELKSSGVPSLFNIQIKRTARLTGDSRAPLPQLQAIAGIEANIELPYTDTKTGKKMVATMIPEKIICRRDLGSTASGHYITLHRVERDERVLWVESNDSEEPSEPRELTDNDRKDAYIIQYFPSDTKQAT